MARSPRLRLSARLARRGTGGACGTSATGAGAAGGTGGTGGAGAGSGRVPGSRIESIMRSFSR
ncbi:hypothetical protein BJP25_20135 [Actinokineospora bangkokensis]|uniref:Uncharacterized protein n=1 Tax=Actinokineospora bangkokensis TaxID=1193682 RepID=A0A1Q9LK41_9PSEU|nr:hypothetical protein BJP25_20135 [Actinokineospora bangkokensis]